VQQLLSAASGEKLGVEQHLATEAAQQDTGAACSCEQTALEKTDTATVPSVWQKWLLTATPTDDNSTMLAKNTARNCCSLCFFMVQIY